MDKPTQRARSNGDSFVVEQVFTPHPRRAKVLAELHARPFQPVPTPCQVFHFALMSDAAAADAHTQRIVDLLAMRGLQPMMEGARHHSFTLAGVDVRWECHTEFTTYSFTVKDGGRDPFELVPPPAIREILGDLPGEVIVATRITLRKPAKGRAPARLFDEASLCVASVGDGSAIVRTDLKPDAAGFTRMLIEDKGLEPLAAGALVLRLLEVETYRCLALLGLPLAQQIGPRVRDIEEALAGVTAEMQQVSGLEANRVLLDRLAGLATETEAIAAETSYRFSAVAAYEHIVQSRLKAIGEQPVGQTPTLGAFLARRLAPAMRTCTSMSARIDDLSEKLRRAASLLRARVDVELESQNRDLLKAMNRRARQQLRLQQTVEGLSVAAVSYYVVGLVGYLAKGAAEAGAPLQPTLVTAISVPLVVAFVWSLVRRLRRSHAGDDPR